MYRYVEQEGKYTERFAPTKSLEQTEKQKTNPDATQQDEEKELNTTHNDFDIPVFKFDLDQNKYIKTIRKELDLDQNEIDYLMSTLQDIKCEYNLDIDKVEETLSYKLVEDAGNNKAKLFNKKPKAALIKEARYDKAILRMKYEDDLKKKRERDKEEEAQKAQEKGKDAKGKDAKDKGGKDKKADAKKDDKAKVGNENIAKAEKVVIRDYKPIGMFKDTTFKELVFTRKD